MSMKLFSARDGAQAAHPTTGDSFVPRFDRCNAALAGFVFLFTGFVYYLTVQPTVSFWDCGEFLASSYILGIPHPPGSPLFVIIGRLFASLPLAIDLCLKINLISVISSALTAMMGYLFTVRVITFWYTSAERGPLTRFIAYIGGLVGAAFLAFGETNWGNAVEAEVYGLTMFLTLFIMWLGMKFVEEKGQPRAVAYMILAAYLAILGIGIHMTVFLVLPVAAIFFVITKDATKSDWVYVCSFFVVELLLIHALSFGGSPNGYMIFLVLSGVLFALLAIKLYHAVNMPWVIAFGAVGLIMIGFWKFVWGLGIAAALIGLWAMYHRKSAWRSGLLILGAALIGFTVQGFVVVRSWADPRIDENNPGKGLSTFVDFFERKQYGQMSMTERMFDRRGLFENQYGRHPNMGFWSYFEEQYQKSSLFAPIFAVGLFGIYFTMRRRVDIGYPYLALLLISSVGLILYMNFADGILYNETTGDAYLEVRNRDYFFTPAFIFFGLAIGLGVAGVMELVRQKVAGSARSTAVYSCGALVALGAIPLSSNYYVNDRSRNYLSYDYANNILQSCPANTVLFTSGDNDTFPLWAMQEVYRVRRDVRIANLSLLNTDWYVAQLKNVYKVPMSLSDSQIVYDMFEQDGQPIARPPKMFNDRPRRRETYLVPQPFDGRVLRVQDMMVDEIVIANRFRDPVAFTAEPYGESPLNLRNFQEMRATINLLTLKPPPRQINADSSYDLYMNSFRFRGMDDPTIYRDENATGIQISVGFGAVRVFNEYMSLIDLSRNIRLLESTRSEGWSAEKQNTLDSLTLAMGVNKPADSAIFRQKGYTIIDTMIARYPEFWMNYIVIADHYNIRQDTTTALKYLRQGEKTLAHFRDVSPANANYIMDLGLLRHEIARMPGDQGDSTLEQSAYDLLWEGFRLNANNGLSYQKLIQYLYETKRNSDIMTATQMHADYKVNRGNRQVQAILGQAASMPDIQEE